jgi:hypothetical protein
MPTYQVCDLTRNLILKRYFSLSFNLLLSKDLILATLKCNILIHLLSLFLFFFFTTFELEPHTVFSLFPLTHFVWPNLIYFDQIETRTLIDMQE